MMYRLIDLLDDKREIIRNETLLLLIALTKSNQEIQKIIAFQNAFERLLNIISEEGAADGGIVVHDCHKLIQNMLHYNISNQVCLFFLKVVRNAVYERHWQNLFRETSCIQKMPELFGDISNAPQLWVPQKIENTLSLLELIRILVGTHNPNVSVNQVRFICLIFNLI